MGGAGWRRFIKENDLIHGTKMLCFSWREPLWSISVIYVDGGEKESLGSTYRQEMQNERRRRGLPP
jgi:hypothetical protein